MSLAATTNAAQSDGVDLRRLFSILRRHLRLIAFCGLLVAGATYGISALRDKQYTATATLLFRDPGFDQRLFGTQFLNSSVDPNRDAATNLGLASLSVTSRATAEALGGKFTEDSVRQSVEAVAVQRSDLVDIKATDPDPATATRIANTFTNEFVRLRREADQRQIAAAQELVEKQLNELSLAERSGPQGQSLAQRGQELRILASLQTGKAEVAQPAEIPDSPSAPRPKRNAFLGLLAGLLLGAVLSFLRERLDRRLRDVQEAEELFDRPIVGGIPKFSAARNSRRGSEKAHSTEAFQMLRTNLRYFNVAEDVQTLLVTSAGAGDGKSTVSAHLASASADAGVPTLLIEADLRNPSLHKLFEQEPVAGLSDVLANQVTLDEAIERVPVIDGRADDSGTPDRTIDVLFAGRIPPNPYDLIDSQAMENLIKEASARYGYVIIDTPPVSFVPDAVPLVRQVNGVLVVARIGHTDMQVLTRLQEQLTLLQAPVLGLVINATDADSAYGYGYGYGYGPPSADGEPVSRA